MDQIHLPPELYDDLQSFRLKAWSGRLRRLIGLLWAGRKRQNKGSGPNDPA
ncbi:hypothetical protein SAMN05444158_4398 [Bradyrhizobium canariense]|jgi:hypothetical protein|uniref:Uncharacterized protein n=1 Tax=Bradyrhizobium canariense TaxID=255045 RepID=A0A1H1XNM9_9BRAD|nr:hypothetical protein SAMN05444158_4398 [Bradyrhizobium canariense]